MLHNSRSPGFWTRFIGGWSRESAWLLVFVLASVAMSFQKIGYYKAPYGKSWDIGLENVYMHMENSQRFTFDSHNGNLEWNSTLPSGEGLLHFGPDYKQVYSVSMFHQLRCLNIVRQSMVAFRNSEGQDKPNRLTHHCMNYLRQMILCRSYTRLESARNPYGPGIAVWDITHTCKDWSAAYAAADKNHNDYHDFLRRTLY
ncbi:hypothetical protein BDQ17DRAFT_1400596 [Cyathus striatus]|nr:hypothetical protein BDQ17DRAFT_1400596 [Cyathus striatus]